MEKAFKIKIKKKEVATKWAKESVPWPNKKQILLDFAVIWRGHDFSGKHAKVVPYSGTSRHISTGAVGLGAWLGTAVGPGVYQGKRNGCFMCVSIHQ